MKSLFVFAVISDDIEAARHRDQELMTFLQGMARAVGTAGHVIKVKNAFYLKWDMAVPFEKSQVPARVVNLRQFDDPTLTQLQFHKVVSDGSMLRSLKGPHLAQAFARAPNST